MCSSDLFSQHVAPLIDLGEVGALGDYCTTLRVLGGLKEKGDILPTSSSPTIISYISLRKEQQGQDYITLVYDFGIGDVKEERNNMTRSSHDRLAELSLLSIDPYWRSQLLVEYSKDLFHAECLMTSYLMEDMQ